MDLDKITMFNMMKGRIGWLNRRQEILAQNVANADTPEYKPHDLKDFDFKDMVQRKQTRLGLATTSPLHYQGPRSALQPFKTVETDRPYETSPDGNAVVLEEQMSKIGETQMHHQLTNELYRKHVGMIKTALGKQR
ncbi:MAG: flagellar basal body rod protein FlgB [Alphaproteobacteria bacterium]|nr:flagellar basal body rod protein FlgB [Alphaproteobacteria bacterium]MBF0251304.1 flagellar basal body rod protein FlgB [Alphaproteobacteria bacterium]